MTSAEFKQDLKAKGFRYITQNLWEKDGTFFEETPYGISKKVSSEVMMSAILKVKLGFKGSNNSTT